MPYVSVPKDLSRVKTKVALNLTKRQIICFSLAISIGVPTYLLARTDLGTEVAVLMMIVLMLPFFFIAMYEKDGQPAEKILRNYLRTRIWPGVRPYKTHNFYTIIELEGKAFVQENKATDTAGKPPANRSKKRPTR